MSEGKKLHQYIAAVSICIGSLAAGTILGWTSNITDELKAGKLNDLDMDDTELGWTGSCMNLGAMIMCFPIGWIADWLGRKPTVLLTIIPFTIGWVLITFAQHVAMVYVGRVLVGVGGGSFSVIAPLYTSEIAQTEIRGTLGTFFQLFITIGILYSGVFGYALPMMVFNFACLIVPLVFGVVFFFQPESPVWDLKKGRNVNAEKNFKKLRGEEYDASGEVAAILKEIEEDKQRQNFWVAMKTKASKRATLICFSLMFFQQFSGINAVMFYSKEIFIDAGSSLPTPWCVIIIGVVQVIATLFAAWAMDKAGRKVLLMASGGGMSFSSFLLGLFFSLKNHEVLDKDGIENIGFLPILSLVIFIIAFSVGLGPIPWLASSEIFSPDIKAKCSSAAATFNWFLAFLVTKFYLDLADAMGNDMTFYIFTVISAIEVFFVLFFVPETKNKSFAEIQAEIGG
ncbi:facilitated trehalose transporter Tret1 [Leptinotarsa decemlineata]|uniref:facilitated trehalose transporter Tret1 n=1 Tax=Leptinotarsa decemlineata TaxID=7539 RepID=UPI000C254745|nr:facilitated trehalose transporter Tret1-like [Leptinotarsa decemlineata]